MSEYLEGLWNMKTILSLRYGPGDLRTSQAQCPRASSSEHNSDDSIANRVMPHKKRLQVEPRDIKARNRHGRRYGSGPATTYLRIFSKKVVELLPGDKGIGWWRRASSVPSTYPGYKVV
jgi:hypothetical protein